MRRHNLKLPSNFYHFDWSVLCGIVQDFQTRTLLGTQIGPKPMATQCHTKNPSGRPWPPCDAKKDAAIEQARNFQAVLTLDDIDDSGPLLRRELGWRQTTFPDENKAKGMAYLKFDELKTSERNLLYAMNKADQALYFAARQQVTNDRDFARVGPLDAAERGE